MSIVQGEITRFNTIGRKEADAVLRAMADPLSGFLGGEKRGGKWVRALEDAWTEKFGVKHAITCNSATSGLMAASFAVGLGPGDRFAVSPYTMSATAAAPMFTGATPDFFDVEDEIFCMDVRPWTIPGAPYCQAIFITNLFGHPSQAMNLIPNLPNSVFVIEDNSQSPLAMERGCYAGTFGDIGVFSLNVHKHIHCGEGGVCVTDDDELAEKIRSFINHGEMAGKALGLNLRLPEISAAIALAQLKRADEIIFNRVEQAHMLLDAIGEIPRIRNPIVRIDCKHVYYTIPFLMPNGPEGAGYRTMAKVRQEFLTALTAEGVPLVEGYVAPLYRLPAFSKFKRECPVADGLHDHRLFYFENCAWSPTKEQIKQIGTAFKKVAEEMKL